MTVSVIIPTIQAQPDMLKTACRLAMNTSGVSEVIVQDGGTFSQNCNTGAARATSEMLVFLNDDTEPQPGWLNALIQPFMDDNTIGITGARLIYPNGNIQHAGVYFTLDNGVLTANNHRVEKPSGFVDAVTAACMAIPRLLFEDLGGFDEGFRSGYEDVDLCLRVIQAGYQIFYAADSNVLHHESQSGPERWRYVNENVHRLQEKWNGWDSGSDTEAVVGADG